MSQSVDYFVSIAEKFQNWVKEEPLAKEKEAVLALDVLSGLYAGAVQIMRLEVEREEPEASESHVVSMDEWKDVYDRLNNMPFAYYCELESPHDSNTEGSYTDFIEDLADIYQDVTEGLNIYREGHTGQALSHWQMTFEFHWGRHALSAMKALHCYFQDDADFSGFSLV